jgi:hypothetical protein
MSSSNDQGRCECHLRCPCLGRAVIYKFGGTVAASMVVAALLAAWPLQSATVSEGMAASGNSGQLLLAVVVALKLLI